MRAITSRRKRTSNAGEESVEILQAVSSPGGRGTAAAKKKRRKDEPSPRSATNPVSVLTEGSKQSDKTATVTASSPSSSTIRFNHEEGDAIVSYISEFLSATKKQKSSHQKECNNSCKTNRSLHRVISYLVDYLQTTTVTESASAHMYITKVDVATLLLPWSVSRLMRMAAASTASTSSKNDHADDGNEMDELAWNALSSCLDLIHMDSSSTQVAPTTDISSNENLLSSCFPQSTLNRLVPYAARIAFSSSQSQACNHPTTTTTIPNVSIPKCASNTFVHLVRRYKSPLDIICKTLLCDVDSLLRLSGNDTRLQQRLHQPPSSSSPIPPPQHQVSIVQATLRLIHATMNNANPKRLFSIICSTEVMPKLGRMLSTLDDDDDGDEILIQSILWDGLFHPVHHMDGFRTMSEITIVPTESVDAQADSLGGSETRKKDKKGEIGGGGGKTTCFQSGLFSSVRTLLSLLLPVQEASTINTDDNDKDAIAASKLLPIIVHGFFERVREHAARQSNKNPEADARLQFRFWCHLILPVLETLFGMKHIDGISNNDAKKSLLGVMSQTIGLVLQYDAYLPSYNDPGEEHLKFLRSVTNGLVRCMDDDDVDDDSNDKKMSDHVEDNALITSFCNMILLNHRLLHGELSKVTYFTCTSLPQKNEEANKLLLTIVKTYRELRSIGDFLSATREAFTNRSQDSTTGKVMKNILLCNNVVDSLAIAYQSCPSGQLQEIWNFFDGWIGESSLNSNTEEISFAVQMFIIFIKSIRSDKQNSPGLRSLCELSMNKSISKLLDNNKAEVDCTRLGFDLCGWLVELHTRSCFWIDNISVDGESSFLLSISNSDTNNMNVLAYLRNTAEAAVASENFSSWKKSFLEAYWQGGNVNVVDAGTSPLLRGSLQRLAIHRIHQLHSMIYYCKLKESDSNESDSNESQSTVLTREAKMLVDFSFFIACSEAIGASGKYAAKEDFTLLTDSLWIPIAQSLPIWSHYSDQFHSELFLIWFFASLCSESSRNSGHISRCEYSTSIALSRDASFYDNDKIMSPLIHTGIKFAMQKSSDDVKATSTALSFIASAPVELINCSDNTKILWNIFHMDVLASKSLRQLQHGQDEQRERLFNDLCSARYILARILSVAVLHSGSKTSFYKNMSRHLLSSNHVDFDMNYLSASSDAINECLSFCIDYYDKEDVLLQEFFSQLLHNVVDDIETSETPSQNAFLLRGVIRKINGLNRHHSLSKRNASSGKSVYDLCTEKLILIHERSWRSISSKISVANSSSSIELLLASELIYFHGSCPVKNAEAMKNTIELFEKVVFIQDSSQEAEMISACNYFLSIMAAVPEYLFECIEQKRVFEQILNSMRLPPIQTNNPLLEAAFCSLIRHADVDELQTVTSVLMNEDTNHSSVFLIKIFYLILSSIKTQEQQKCIAGYCKQFLFISMDLLRDQFCDIHQINHRVGVFSRMMSTLLARKELLVLSGREIAMVCSEMNPLFRIDRVTTRDIACDISIFTSCSSVVASLIAHYSKQLYGCPSPLFGLLLSLLTDILHANTRGLPEKALEYSKLCELLVPHKEIFKKHAVGLILCYIKALSVMSPITKKKLMPSIYALLDVCSDFETRQINAMIDVTSKTLFAPVFRSYQKFYQYHGQA